jgi:hypothetical protein
MNWKGSGRKRSVVTVSVCIHYTASFGSCRESVKLRMSVQKEKHKELKGRCIPREQISMLGETPQTFTYQRQSAVRHQIGARYLSKQNK